MLKMRNIIICCGFMCLLVAPGCVVPNMSGMPYVPGHRCYHSHRG